MPNINPIQTQIAIGGG